MLRSSFTFFATGFYHAFNRATSTYLDATRALVERPRVLMQESVAEIVKLTIICVYLQ